MSYSSYIQIFNDGESHSESFEKIEKLLAGWGKIVEGGGGLSLVRETYDIFSDCFLSGSRDGGVSGIAFERPQDHELFYEIVFQLLSIPQSCYFGVDLEFILSRSTMNDHYPRELVENVQPTVIDRGSKKVSYGSLS